LKTHKSSLNPNSDDVDFYTEWCDGADDLSIDAIVARRRKQKLWRFTGADR
jgi:hypothetical protein